MKWHSRDSMGWYDGIDEGSSQGGNAWDISITCLGTKANHWKMIVDSTKVVDFSIVREAVYFDAYNLDEAKHIAELKYLEFVLEGRVRT